MRGSGGLLGVVELPLEKAGELREGMGIEETLKLHVLALVASVHSTVPAFGVDDPFPSKVVVLTDLRGTGEAPVLVLRVPDDHLVHPELLQLGRDRSEPVVAAGAVPAATYLEHQRDHAVVTLPSFDRPD